MGMLAWFHEGTCVDHHLHLVAHRCQLMGEMPFACSVCSCSFVLKWNITLIPSRSITQKNEGTFKGCSTSPHSHGHTCSVWNLSGIGFGMHAVLCAPCQAPHSKHKINTNKRETFCHTRSRSSGHAWCVWRWSNIGLTRAVLCVLVQAPLFKHLINVLTLSYMSFGKLKCNSS